MNFGESGPEGRGGMDGEEKHKPEMGGVKHFSAKPKKKPHMMGGNPLAAIAASRMGGGGPPMGGIPGAMGGGMPGMGY